MFFVVDELAMEDNTIRLDDFTQPIKFSLHELALLNQTIWENDSSMPVHVIVLEIAFVHLISSCT